MSQTILLLGPADHGRPTTLGEFREAEGVDGYGYELARGVLQVLDWPERSHRQVVSNLTQELCVYDPTGDGLIARVERCNSQIEIPRRDADGRDCSSIRRPDVGVILKVAPDGERRAIVAEVVAPGIDNERRDYQEKRVDYWELGVPEYWIVDPIRRVVLTHVREAGADDWTTAAFRDGAALTSPLLPGFVLPVERLWRNLDDAEVESGGRPCRTK